MARSNARNQPRSAAGFVTTLTPALLAKIEEAALAGLKDPEIYTLLGIPKQTWSDWSNADGPHHRPDLSDAIARARARLVYDNLRTIRAGAKGWQANAWLIALHFPERYPRPGANTQVNVSASASANAHVVGDDELARLQATREQLLRRMDGGAGPN